MQSISTLSGIAVARAEGSVIEDLDGNRFLDLAAGICVNAFGHAHPRYRQILKDQIDEVTVGSFTTLRRAQALEKIASHAPKGLDKIQLYSGGTEAVEAAMRLAKSHTKKYEFLSFWGGFHGKTAGTMSLIGDGTKNGLGPSLPGTYLTPYADCYRCPFGLRPPCAVFPASRRHRTRRPPHHGPRLGSGTATRVRRLGYGDSGTAIRWAWMALLLRGRGRS